MPAPGDDSRSRRPKRCAGAGRGVYLGGAVTSLTASPEAAWAVSRAGHVLPEPFDEPANEPWPRHAVPVHAGSEPAKLRRDLIELHRRDDRE
jgi:hypothetical protein